MKKKTVLVTGASRGIGYDTAKLFYENDYNVVINYKTSKEKAEQLSAELPGSLAIYADISNPSDVRNMFDIVHKKFGGVDVLVNNAGISHTDVFGDVSYERWREIFATNVDGAFNCTKEALPYMINQKNGKIVNVSSIWGITGASCEVAYSTTKAAIIGFTKALAKELGPSNICVNCVAPGIVDTDMNKNIDTMVLSQLIEEIPLEKIGTTRDIANTILFLASDLANYITGQVLSPNGGMVI